VKRVLSRYFAIEGWSGKKAVESLLWQKAEACTPDARLADYTQAMMDLGASVCTRSSPDCAQCPLMKDCLALKNSRVNELPTARPKKQIPVKTVRMLLLINEKGELLIEKRPPTGIWGGLWSLPELALDADVAEACEQRWGYQLGSVQDQAGLRHTFSHYHLDITPCRAHVVNAAPGIREPGQQRWCNAQTYKEHALATPVASILQQHLQ
jgi:A/G-specific adenine glycosylase